MNSLATVRAFSQGGDSAEFDLASAAETGDRVGEALT